VESKKYENNAGVRGTARVRAAGALADAKIDERFGELRFGYFSRN
jgi:hypothetical protein